MSTDETGFLETEYYEPLLRAFLSGKAGLQAERLSSLLEEARACKLRFHKFKRSELPRVVRVLGILKGLAPSSLLDIGSGRGTFLWPLLDAFPLLKVHALDIARRRVEDICSVIQGGIANLSASLEDMTQLSAADRSFDVVSALEVLEHQENPQLAAQELVRVARRFVVASVPSKPDNNPEHLHLFSASDLETLFLDAGAARVSLDYVHDHTIALVVL